METYKKFKLVKEAIKIIVVTLGIWLTIYAGMLCFGVSHWASEMCCIIIGYSLMFSGCWIFKVCKLTWCFAIYILAFRICMVMRKEDMFGEYLDLAHWIMFIIGLILTIWFLLTRKYRKDESIE